MVCLAMSSQLSAADLDPRRIGPSATLTFDSKKAVLTQDSKDKLDALIKNAKNLGQINEVQVAAWSDNPAPRDGEELSKSDQ